MLLQNLVTKLLTVWHTVGILITNIVIIRRKACRTFHVTITWHIVISHDFLLTSYVNVQVHCTLVSPCRLKLFVSFEFILVFTAIAVRMEDPRTQLQLSAYSHITNKKIVARLTPVKFAIQTAAEPFMHAHILPLFPSQFCCKHDQSLQSSVFITVSLETFCCDLNP